MLIKSLELQNFRNFLRAKFDFSKINIIYGPNGMGKTNVLESIYLLAATKSFRNVANSKIIFWGKNWARILGEIQKNERKIKLEVILGGLEKAEIKNKSFKINGRKSKLVKAVGTFRVVFFAPESLEIITGSPVLRRRFLDILISQVDKKYLQNLAELKRVLKNRNQLLLGIKEGKNSASELDFWDQKLIELSAFVIGQRFLLIKFLNKFLTQLYSMISLGTHDSFRVKYMSRILPNHDFKNLTKKEIQNIICQKMRQQILSLREQEIERGQTLIGPQRDDLIFVLNGRNVATAGSRGEIRSAIIAIKIAETEFLKTKSGDEPPVILLDDVYSELDMFRRKSISRLFSNCQTIITTTDKTYIFDRELLKKAKIIKLK